MEPQVRQNRILQTYLWHPTAQVERHLLVSTRKLEGYNPANNYNVDTETMVFGGLAVDREIEGEKGGDSTGIYKMHNDTVQRFVSQGYRKLKTKLTIVPASCSTSSIYQKKAA